MEHDRAQWFFFAAIDGIAPEFAFNGKPPRPCRPGPEVAFTLKSPRGGKVHFVVLDASQGARLARLQIAGRPFLALSPNALLPGTNASLSLETLGNETMGLALFPAPREVGLLGKTLGSRSLGVFTGVKLPKLAPSVQPMDAADLRPAQVTPQPLNAMQDSAWKSAAVWRISVLPTDRNTVLRLVYVGDVIRIYAGGRLLLDQFYHGQPLDLPLWRIPPADLGRLEVQIMPLHKGFSGRLPNGASPDFGETISQANLLQASLLDRRQMELKILP
jgi:beta-galactosidase